MRTAVVGHTEWIEFGRVERVPAAGDIAHTTDAWEVPGGGGAVAAVQLARLAGSCTFFTALGDDERGAWSRRDLEALGVRVEAATRPEITRRAVVFVDERGERTITTFGRRLDPIVGDALSWDELEATDAVYFTAGDVGALREARRASVLVATSRIADFLAEHDVQLDALVGSGSDPAEIFDPSAFSRRPHLVVRTDGVRGGRYETSDGRSGSTRPLLRRGRSSTRTEPATRSRPGSPSGSHRRWTPKDPSGSPLDAVPGASPDEGHTSTSQPRPTSPSPTGHVETWVSRPADPQGRVG